MNKYLRTNRAVWDERAVIHARGNERYRVSRLLSGRKGWEDPIPDRLGSVRGKRLLHLQCHIGLDSLFWARQGAKVTGVDFAPKAVEVGRTLSRQSGIPARFIESDIDGLPRKLKGKFDIVITTYGVLCWLPDLTRWANVVARFLDRGGFLYLAEIHPFFDAVEFPGGKRLPEMRNSYFASGVVRSEWAGTYAVPQAPTRQNVHYGWQHSISEVIEALLQAGLFIDYLHEFPYVYCNLMWNARRRLMRRDSRRFWHLIGMKDAYSLIYSIKAGRNFRGRR